VEALLLGIEEEWVDHEGDRHHFLRSVSSYWGGEGEAHRETG